MRLLPPKQLLSKLQTLIPKKADRQRTFYTLLFTDESVAAAAWYPGRNGKTEILASNWQTLDTDSWEDREEACDRALVALETKTQEVDTLRVVLGFPNSMLTRDGDIRDDVRAHVKKLVRDLNLSPLGYVAFDQALAYAIKQEDGVPASVILLGIAGTVGTLTVYKVGSSVGRVTITISDDVAEQLEAALKGIKNLEVLPSRIILYGSKDEFLLPIRQVLMKHSWTTKLNFLHFPKIDVLSTARLVSAVCFAGASQLPSIAQGKTVMARSKDITRAEETVPYHTEATPEESDQEDVSQEEEPEETEEAEGYEEEEDRETRDGDREEETVPQETEEPEVHEAEHNVVIVDPEKLGFHKNVDVLEKRVEKKKEHEVEKHPPPGEALPSEIRKPVPVRGRTLMLPDFRSIVRIFSGMRFPQVSGVLPFLAILILLLAAGGFSYWMLPKAAVTVYELPTEFTEESTVTVDPGAQAVDVDTHTIPGRAQSKSVSGEKTIAVTGKKKVGDPAKGTVTIYNKSLASRTFTKGTTLSSGSVKFTLDDDVSIASASENLVNGTVTFGKGNAQVTAVAIGTQGNLPAGSEFALEDVSSSTAVARNDEEFTGGTSREVTVVTRDDQDILVGELTKELIEKAKGELSESVTGGEKLIDSTIQTKVTEKSFAQELDQEAASLQGSITVEVSGISYNDMDIINLAKDAIAKRLPEGYMLDEGQGVFETSKVTVQKDGTIRLTTTYKTAAAAKLNVDEIKKNLAGKTLSKAQEYLQGIHGVSAASFEFRWTPGKNRLPMNTNNISVSVAFEGE